MSRSSRENISKQLSLYLDGMLDAAAASEIERRVREEPDVAAELEELRQLREMLGKKTTLSRQPAFWALLQDELNRRKTEQENLLPFPRKYLPVGIATAIVAVVAVGIIVFQQRLPILQYLSEQSQAVQKSIQNDILQGAVLPLFRELDNDQMLEFAMFGTLPLDQNSEKALRVDEDSESGYRIEMGQTVSQANPQVTVEDLFAEIRPTAKEVRAIDSLLENAKERIAWSAFVAENNAIAIDPELTRLNRSMLVAIAQNLEPQRRARFDRFLEKRKARYSVAGLVSSPPSVPPPPKSGVIMSPPEPVQRNFVILTPDTFVLSPVLVNVGRMEEKRARGLERTSEMHVRVENTIKEIGRKRMKPPPKETNHDVVFGVEGGSDYVRVNVRHRAVPPTEDSVVYWATPRRRTPVVFRFEQQVQIEGGHVTTTIIHQDLDELIKQELNKAYEMERKARVMGEEAQRIDSFEVLLRYGIGDTAGIRYSRPEKKDTGSQPDRPERKRSKY